MPGEYFRDSVLHKKIIPFLKNPENVIEPKEVTFLHDCAPCMKAMATQELVRANVDFFGNNEYPANSPDLNEAEHMGSIMKGGVEKLIEDQPEENGHSHETLLKCIKKALKSLETATHLFVNILESYFRRTEAV
ncbi:unnamed protein product [Owenia fusiformis]|uniref:Uncharacterized protein n=1 Tax=Owenia fusiformis TaxID=6347 RepID=A0A8J1Y599_OWEFU|nr:unnamed protein product [Owenia fusiformis]